jgi:hypothetical protein
MPRKKLSQNYMALESKKITLLGKYIDGKVILK